MQWWIDMELVSLKANTFRVDTESSTDFSLFSVPYLWNGAISFPYPFSCQLKKKVFRNGIISYLDLKKPKIAGGLIYAELLP